MSKSMIKKALLVAGLVAMAGCSNLNRQEQRILTGAAAGTAIGAAGTVLTGGCVSCGAAIGGAVGAGAGYVMDRMDK